MKVICINNKDGEHKAAYKLLKEGQEYNVWQGAFEDCYEVEGIEFDPGTGIRINFNKDRFIPESDYRKKELLSALITCYNLFEAEYEDLSDQGKRARLQAYEAIKNNQ